MTARPSFQQYEAAGYAGELLPIAPPGAKLSPRCKSISPNQLGKIPTYRSRDGWLGCTDWPSRKYEPGETLKFQLSGAGIGIQGRSFPAIDVDISREDVAEAVQALAHQVLGAAPIRVGRAPRRLLVYRGDVAPRSIAFTHPCDPAPAPGENPVRHLVEVLGRGRHWVAEGIHPKTGQAYAWATKRLRADQLTDIDESKLDEFFTKLETLICEMGGEPSGRHQGARAGPVPPAEDLLAPSLDDVRAALMHLPNHGDNALGYEDWFRTLPQIKGASGGSAEGLELAHAWSSGELTGGVDADNPKYDAEDTQRRWDSVRIPRTGWRELLLRVRGAGKAGAEFAVQYDFDAVDAGNCDADAPRPPDSVANMFRRYAWVEGVKRAVDLATGDLLDQEQFEFRVPPLVFEKPPAKEGGKPTKVKTSAWKVFKDNPKHRKSYKNLTCRFGGALEVEENLPNLEGLCLNTWREPKRPRPLPDSVTDEDVAEWLALAEHVIPVASEREHVFDYCAYMVQKPDEKINHALVIGSRSEGVGKDTLFEPVRCAIGPRYVKEISPEDFHSTWTDWLVGCKLAIVQEMHNFERRAVGNKLKPLIAAPPAALPVGKRFTDQFYIPNTLQLVFFTNEDNALVLSRGDRRYFVTWNDGEPKPQEFYERVWAWLREGGAEKAARWLMQRDVSHFNAKGRAPATAAKEEMRKGSRSPLEEVLEDALAERRQPFDRDLILLQDVMAWLPLEVTQRPTGHRVSPWKQVNSQNSSSPSHSRRNPASKRFAV